MRIYNKDPCAHKKTDGNTFKHYVVLVQAFISESY